MSRLLATALSAALVAWPTTHVRAQRRSAPPDDASRIRAARWEEEEIGIGVLLRRHRFDELFGAPQSVVILELAAGTALDVVQGAPRARTSALSAGFGGVAGVNGGFFNTKTGAPIGLIQIDGASVVPATEVQRTGQSAFGVDARNRVLVREVPPGIWAGVEDALGGSALLVENGRAVDWSNAKRHPRTVLGVRRDGTVLLVCVDGRTPQAAGMSYAELSTLMLALDCEAAVNLDGGGSSTMWTAGLGIVNHPSDNGKFDAEGERSVANAVVVTAPAVRVLDEEALGLPADAETLDGLEDAYRGDVALLSAEDAVEVVFSLTAPRPGTYAVEARWPRMRSEKTGRVQVEVGDAAVDTKTLDQRSKAGRWQRFATIEFGAEPVEITWRGESGTTLLVDAIRLVETRERRR